MVADYQGVAARFPLVDKSVDPAVWQEFFERNPEELARLLGSIHSVVKQGTGVRRRGGPRPRGSDTWDGVYDMVIPDRYSPDPFPVAMRELLGTQSLRGFAMKIPMSHNVLWKMVSGQRPVEVRFPNTSRTNVDATLDRLADIARAGKVTPAYFLEWRVLWIQQALAAALAQQPNLSIGIVRQLQRVVTG